ncbi:hypothetical protein AB6A40_009671 [Gnathostoma spinigerum]|uniref:Aspartic peptidase DDI1-type domain-containing protein n=1 Tax=Gnathostoma spinigerum TaxID=75299 RepID=A0ABD6EV31_9BILA
MRVTVSTDAVGANIFSVEVGAEMEMENFLALCQIEFPAFAGIPASGFSITHNGQILMMNNDNLKKTFEMLGVHNDDIVVVMPKTALPKDVNFTSSSIAPSAATSKAQRKPSPATMDLIASLVKSIKVPTSTASRSNSRGLKADEMTQLRTLFADLQTNFERRERMRSIIPSLVEAAEKNDFDEFCSAFIADRERMLIRQKAMLDPTNPEGQRLIAEQIQQENINFSHQFAMEHMPESYIPVTMLYIRMKINGIEVKAFVDSGGKKVFPHS